MTGIFPGPERVKGCLVQVKGLKTGVGHAVIEQIQSPVLRDPAEKLEHSLPIQGFLATTDGCFGLDFHQSWTFAKERWA